MSPEQRNSPVVPAIWIASVGVLISLADLPYGYFMLLRFVLCGISLFLLFGVHLGLVDWERWLLGAFAVLYNPLLPIRIGEKRIWIGLNIATIAFFWFVGTRPIRHLRQQQQKATDDKVYAEAYFGCLSAGGTKRDAYRAARKAIGVVDDEGAASDETG